MNYWKWLIKGREKGKPGIYRFFDYWLLIHFVFGISLSLVVPATLKEAANTVLLPLAGIFIGLSFAWGGNAQALLQATEIEEMSEYHPGGFEEYVFVYQTAILLILITLVLWGLAGFGIFDDTWPKACRGLPYIAVGTILFLFASLTLRECWQVVIGAQMMLIVKHKIGKKKFKNDK
jgi:hypothetical protein